ncbi:hypothetical protein [Halostella litorea]|uniref:hypothetical protein n=1 Tax=Halostella litorea TaxID=2528831 RepID=UPI001092636F|nr:hypothetical protein [Halostella litorea]
MRLTSLLSARTAEDRRETEETTDSDGGVRGRLVEEARSGRLAVATGLLWIVRGLRSAEGRGRRVAFGVIALAVGLFQRRSRSEGGTLPAGDLTETVRDVAPGTEGDDGASGMTDVELDGPDEHPEDMQSDMAASDEMTEDDELTEEDDDPEADADEVTTEETPAGDEHETDVGTAGEGETGIDLGSDSDAEDEPEGEDDEGMAVETDGDEGSMADGTDGDEDDDTPPEVAESFEDNEDDEDDGA